MWLLPTLNRIEKLKAFLKSAQDTGVTTPGRVVIDKGDFATHQEAYVEINNSLLPPSWALEITDAVSMGDKCREVIPKLKPETQWVGLLNDDHFCVTKEWDKLLIAKLDGQNFVSANDRTVNAFRLPVTATAWSMPLLQSLGWPIYPPFLQHLFIDNIWLDFGRAAGCWRMVASAVVEHNHVLHGKGADDETHQKVYNKESWQKDEQGYLAFKNSPDFNLAVQKIKQFQGYSPGQQWNPKVYQQKPVPVDSISQSP